MKIRGDLLILAVVLAASCGILQPLSAQNEKQPANKVVTMTVTAHGQRNQPPPPVQTEDVQVHQKKDLLHVADWKPATGPLNFYIVIDDALSQDAALNFGEIKDFINGLPENTRVAVGYASHGTVAVAQDFTEDRDKAAKALRIPLGNMGSFASPYLSLSDLVKRLPDAPERREILFISSGFDPFGGNQLNNTYLSTAVEQAQRSNVQVFNLYAEGASHRSRHFFAVSNAQGNLAKLADDTGGDFYALGTGSPISFKPHLDALLNALAHQYILSVNIPAKDKGYWTSVKISSELHGVEFDHASSVWVLANQ